jgi:hypothetical protein
MMIVAISRRAADERPPPDFPGGTTPLTACVGVARDHLTPLLLRLVHGRIRLLRPFSPLLCCLAC